MNLFIECESQEQSFVSIYEIGTGEFVGEVSKVSTATSLTFSSDGSFVVIGCHKGKEINEEQI